MAEICVTLARKRHSALFEEMQAAKSAGVKLLEIRLDYLASKPRIHDILQHRFCPIIFTIRRPKDGGLWGGKEDERQQLLRTLIGMGVDYVDIEWQYADRLPRFGATKRIISHHEMDKMPAKLDELYANMKKRDPDIIKIAGMATHPNDNFAMLSLVRKADIPTVGLCMGELGTASRVLNAKFGSPFTYGYFNPLRQVAPGMLSFLDLRDLYHYESINADTEVFGVIGDPIAQSLSPHVHNAAYRHLQLNKVYVPWLIPRDDAEDFLAELKKTGWMQGVSVTIPHKQTVCKYGEPMDELTKRMQSANTMVWHEGRYLLYNTDGPAAVAAVELMIEPHPVTGERSLKGLTVMILGAGGAARTIALSFAQKKKTIVIITARDKDKSHILAAEVRCKTVDWNARHNQHVDILVNCTPMGMMPDLINESPFYTSSVTENMIVFDTVYNPENTRLIKESRARGAKVVTGIEMFVRQAEAQFKLFTGKEPPLELMMDRCREEQSAAKKMLRESRIKEEAQS